MVMQLDLKDKIIDKLESNFIVDGEANSIKQLEQVRYSFPHCKGMLCQGLGLIHKRKTKLKKIILDYWLNTGTKVLNEDKTIDWENSTGWEKLPSGRIVWGESRRYVMGYYNKETFNVKHIEEKIAALRTDYGNPNNLTWDLDIYEGEQLKKRSRYSKQLTALQDYTVNQVVESWYDNGCPKINKPSESLNKSSLSDNNRYLIGYHERTKPMRFSADENNNGLIKFTDTSGIESMKELFKKYPSQDLNKFGEGISIYDGVLGQKNIREITEFDIRNYITTVATSAGTQRQLKEMLSLIWNHALNKSMLGSTPPINPISQIKIERPTTSRFTKYDTEEFTKSEQAGIYHACIKMRNEFVFQTQLILLMMFCGRRRNTLLKLQWQWVEWNEETHIIEGKKVTTYGKVVIPKHINKTKKPDKFMITEMIRNVLLDLKKQRQEMGWSMFSDWMFPSTRIVNKHLLTSDNRANKEEDRIKDVIGLWQLIKLEVGFKGPAAMKMFRNTYENTVNRNRNAASTWDVISVTGRADTGSSEKAYLNKSFTPSVTTLSTSVDEEFSNIIRFKKAN